MPWVHNASPEAEEASHYPTIIAVTVAFCILMLAVVTTRGIYRRDSLGWDDWVVFGTALCSVTYTVMAVVQTRFGLGLPLDLRPKADTHTFRVLSYAGKPWYPLTLAGYKLALCISYLRLIHGAHMLTYRRVIIAVGAGSALIQVVFILINLFNCNPIKKSFGSAVPGTCLPFPQVQYPMAVISIACDVVVFLLPIPLFVRLTMERRTVIGLCFLFGCGLITTICSIIRATHLKDVGPTGNGDNTLVVVMGSVEANVGIIMSCLPFLRTLLLNVVKKSSFTTFGYRSRRTETAGTANGGLSLDNFARGDDVASKTVVTSGKERPSLSGSEDAILYADDGSLKKENGILMTTHVDVSTA